MADPTDYFNPDHPEHEAFWRHINFYLDQIRPPQLASCRSQEASTGTSDSSVGSSLGTGPATG